MDSDLNTVGVFRDVPHRRQFNCTLGAGCPAELRAELASAFVAFGATQEWVLTHFRCRQGYIHCFVVRNPLEPLKRLRGESSHIVQRNNKALFLRLPLFRETVLTKAVRHNRFIRT
jgi:hypothetical protein